MFLAGFLGATVTNFSPTNSAFSLGITKPWPEANSTNERDLSVAGSNPPVRAWLIASIALR